jgi:hypothetical protein
MFRKHLRFRRRLLVGLAFAAVVVPTAPAGAASLSTFIDNGRVAPKSNTVVLSTPPSYLRYHEVGAPVAAGPVARSERSYSASAQLTPETKRFLAMAKATQRTITPLQADGLRWNAMAKFYAQQNQPSVAISERSNGVKGPDPSLVPQVVLATSSGFDWADAGVGASTVFGAALLLGIALYLTRRNQHTGLTSA